MKYINLISEEQLNKEGYAIPPEWREQVDILLNNDKLLRQTRIDTELLSVHVGIYNKLVAFVTVNKRTVESFRR